MPGTFTGAAQRVLVGVPGAKLRATLLDQDGNPAAPAGTVTVTITRADGTALATNAATTAGASTGQRLYTLDAGGIATIDTLTAEWSDDGQARLTTQHRIVGGFLFDRKALQSMPGCAGFDPADLDRSRDEITDLFERFTRRAFSPGVAVDTFDGRGAYSHVLAHRSVRAVRSIVIDGQTASVDAAGLDPRTGVLRGPRFAGPCTIVYEHGEDSPTAELRRLALIAARDALIRESSGISTRARSQTSDTGVTMQFGYAGKDHPTGIDEVDALLIELRDASAGIG